MSLYRQGQFQDRIAAALIRKVAAKDWRIRYEGFTVLGISRDQGEPEMVRTFLARKGITYPVAMAWQASLEEFEVGGLPTSFLLGRDGRIKHRVEGVFAEPALRMAVRVLLQDSIPTEMGATAGGSD